MIEEQTGYITMVHINILNINDIKPKFSPKNYKIDLREEIVPAYVVIQVTATYPNI